MIDLDYSDPKLARGLVREELRPLKTAFKKPVYENLFRYMQGQVEQRMPPTGKMSNTAANKARVLLHKQALSYLDPIKPFHTKLFLTEGDTKASEVDGFFYWHPSPAVVNNILKDKQSFIGEFVELRCMRIGSNRRRLIIDDLFCHFITSEHCLMRMLERGVQAHRPLQELTNNFDTVIPTAIMFAIAFNTKNYGRYPHVLIPYHDGILLCRLSMFDIEGDNSRWFRWRGISDRDYTKGVDYPVESFFTHTQRLPGGGTKEGAVTVYAATFIPHHQMTTEQIWAKMQIDRLIEEEQDYFSSYLKMVYMLEDLDAKLPPHLNELKAKMGKITSNPRWTIATSANLLQAG